MLRFLSFRDRTEKEVREKLKNKGIDEETAEEAILWLKEEGLLDDRNFARRWVEERKGRFGADRLLRELLQKGVKREIAEEAIRDLTHEEEFETALKLAEKRLRLLPPGPKRRAKISSFLQRRGFSWEIIEDILRVLFSSP